MPPLYATTSASTHHLCKLPLHTTSPCHLCKPPHTTSPCHLSMPLHTASARHCMPLHTTSAHHLSMLPLHTTSTCHLCMLPLQATTHCLSMLLLHATSACHLCKLPLHSTSPCHLCTPPLHPTSACCLCTPPLHTSARHCMPPLHTSACHLCMPHLGRVSYAFVALANPLKGWQKGPAAISFAMGTTWSWRSTARPLKGFCFTHCQEHLSEHSWLYAEQEALPPPHLCPPPPCPQSFRGPTMPPPSPRVAHPPESLMGW